MVKKLAKIVILILETMRKRLPLNNTEETHQCLPFSQKVRIVEIQFNVRLESGEVGMELWNTLGGGKTRESGNAGGAEMLEERKCGKHRKAEKRNVIG